jgi:ferredoxin--NADP+ reductase
MQHEKQIRPVSLPDSQTVNLVEHWTDRLFSFRITRPSSLRFRSGEFVMIGLFKDDKKPLLRAYSIASPSWDDELEFYSIKVQDGPLTSRLQYIQPGDEIILRPKPVGTLVHDALLPGKRIWFFSTGTGIAPFASLVRDPQTYEDYEQVILTHTCRDVNELAYGERLVAQVKDDALIGELARERLIYYPTTTREPSTKMGRITTLLEKGTLFKDLEITDFSAQNDRAMVCGSIGLNTDMKRIFATFQMYEGANSSPAQYVVEKAFVG